MRTAPPVETLTAYDIRIGRSVAEGASDVAIAAFLAISPCALEFHLRPIYKKVGVESRTQLAGVAAVDFRAYPGREGWSLGWRSPLSLRD